MAEPHRFQTRRRERHQLPAHCVINSSSGEPLCPDQWISGGKPEVDCRRVPGRHEYRSESARSIQHLRQCAGAAAPRRVAVITDVGIRVQVNGGSMTGRWKVHARSMAGPFGGHCIALLGCGSLAHRYYVARPSVTPSLRTRGREGGLARSHRSRQRAWLGRCRRRSGTTGRGSLASSRPLGRSETPP